MEMNEIIQKTIGAVSIAFRKPVNEINLNSRYIEDLNGKSLNLFQLVSILGEYFSVKISFAEAKNNITVNDTVEMIKSKLDT